MALFGLSSRMTYLRNSLRTPRRTNPSTLLRYSPIHVQRPTAQDFSSRGIHQVPELKYIPFGFEEVEDVELYKPGGLHPAVIGDVLDRGRYRLVHKLGHGVASTIWLARDSLTLDEQDSIGPLVCIKIPKASKGITLSQTSEEMRVTRALHDLATNRGRKDIHSQLLPIHSSFVEIGPNGYHECLVSSAGGPNVKSMYQKSLGRCRSDLARNICRQVAETLHFVHSCGHAHGG
jgi:serine/threonine-protein kinase SRPK3